MAASTTIQLVLGGSSLTIPAPQWGYSATCRMLTRVTWLASGQPRISDHAGSAYNSRRCRCVFSLAESDSGLLFELVRDTGRGVTISLALGASPCGFFPFGPDLGDVGTFTVRLLSVSPGGMQESPYRHFPVSVEMVLITAPSYALPAVRSEGDFSVGGCGGLLWPQLGFNPAASLSVSHALSQSGAPYAVDLSEASDSWISSWVQQCNQGNAAALADMLTRTIRADDCVIVAPVRFWPFGVYQAETDGSGTYTANLVAGDATGYDIEMRHVHHERWEIPVTYWMQARAV